MPTEQYWMILLKRWWLIAACTLFVGIGAYGGSRLQTPLYQSSVTIQVQVRSSSSPADYTNLLASDQLVQTEAQLAVSDPVLQAVAVHYPGLSVSQLQAEVSQSPQTNTQLFVVSVLDPSPIRAASIANTIATTLITQQQGATQQQNQQAQQQIQQDLSNTQQEIATSAARIASLQASYDRSGQLSAEQVHYQALQQHYTQLQVALVQLELSQAESTNILSVVQPAQPSRVPARPNVLLTTGGGSLVGLLLGVLLAVFIEQLDTRVRTAEVAGALLEWPVLATVWQTGKGDKKLIDPQGPNKEAYRILRTSIGLSTVDKPIQSLVVTSATSGDGKSVIAANLAIFMAKAGKNTLLVDADLRRPTQHRKFNIQQTSGLSNAVLAFGANADATLDPFVHSVNIPNLRVIPSGPLPPNPPELLDSKAMQRLLGALARYGAEVIIFDAPPLLGLSDATILASKVDGTVFVADVTSAHKGALRQVKSICAQAGVNVIGCVVNKKRRSHKEEEYYYYAAAAEQDVDAARKREHRSSQPVGADRMNALDERAMKARVLAPGANASASFDAQGRTSSAAKLESRNSSGPAPEQEAR